MFSASRVGSGDEVLLYIGNEHGVGEYGHAELAGT